MDLQQFFADFATHLHSDTFRDCARHPDHPNAFSRHRKLPLPTLIAIMLCGLRKSVQAELDYFFACLAHTPGLLRHASAQAFAQARAKLAPGALPALNDHLLRQADAAGLVPRWHGLRRIAVDGSYLQLGVRASHVPRAASADKLAMGFYLPDADLMLAASLHSTTESERQALFEHLDRLGPGDLLLLDRGYPCRWLIAALQQRNIGFCMRVDTGSQGGFAAVHAFLRSDHPEQIVTLPAPDKRDAVDYGCPSRPLTVRLVRHTTPDGAVRVLMTSLMDAARFPARVFGDLYHQRWSIEEAFKRLKHRLNIEQVTGLSQLAVHQDFAAKVLCDNLSAIAIQAARKAHNVPAQRRTNRAYAYTAVTPLLPALLLGRACSVLLAETLRLIASQTYKHRPGLSKPRKPRQKPHRHMSFKPC